MATFGDIVNFANDDKDVDKDIRRLLETGNYKSSYTDMVKEFLISEIANCQNTINDERFHLVFGPELEDVALTDTEKKQINSALDWLDFNQEKKDFWSHYLIDQPFGRQKSPPLSQLSNQDKMAVIYPYLTVDNPLYTVYTNIHELTHGYQCKQEFLQQDSKPDPRYELLYKGKSLDEANEILAKENQGFDSDRHFKRCINEQEANAAGSCYVMLQAVRTGNPEIIAKTERQLLNISASMSRALANDRLGLAYFEYPATKQIIADVKSGKYNDLLNEQGLLNWNKFYPYIREKVADMGYTKEDIAQSLETAKMLKEIRTKHPDNKEEFLKAVEKTAEGLTGLHQKVFRQFVAAQRDYQPTGDSKLNFLYRRLRNEKTRETVLNSTSAEQIPQIEEYRKIYQKAQTPTFERENKAFTAVKEALKSNSDFPTFLNKKLQFDGRTWSYGQFLFKHFYDEAMGLGFKIQNNEPLNQTEKQMAPVIIMLHEKNMANVNVAWNLLETKQDLGIFEDKEKLDFYSKLLTDGRSVPGNPCYLHPVYQYALRFAESGLKDIGMTDEQIKTLMTDLEQKREQIEQKAIQNMPEQFIHSSITPPEQMKDATGNPAITTFARSDDNFLNIQKYAFIASPDSFHHNISNIKPRNSEEKHIDSRGYSRFKSDVYIVNATPEETAERIVPAYNYKVDMSDKSAFRPCVPLWGGDVAEWVSVKPLQYEQNPEKETLTDLIANSKKIYCLPNREDFIKFDRTHRNSSTTEAGTDLLKLSKENSGAVIDLGAYIQEKKEQFLANQQRIEKIRGILNKKEQIAEQPRAKKPYIAPKITIREYEP